MGVLTKVSAVGDLYLGRWKDPKTGEVRHVEMTRAEFEERNHLNNDYPASLPKGWVQSGAHKAVRFDTPTGQLGEDEYGELEPGFYEGKDTDGKTWEAHTATHSIDEKAGLTITPDPEDESNEKHKIALGTATKPAGLE